MGPFYCPNDEKLYIDLAFLRELQTRFRAPRDFAAAYVIDHEVGHHVRKVHRRLRSSGSDATAANPTRTRYAWSYRPIVTPGVWGHYAGTMNQLDSRRYCGRVERRGRRGRRQHPKTNAGPRKPRVVYARLIRAASALVQAGTRFRADRAIATRLHPTLSSPSAARPRAARALSGRGRAT